MNPITADELNELLAEIKQGDFEYVVTDDFSEVPAGFVPLTKVNVGGWVSVDNLWVSPDCIL